MAFLTKEEIFREVPGFPRLQLSNRGRVKWNDNLLVTPKTARGIRVLAAVDKHGRYRKLYIEIEMLKLFPELRLIMDKNGNRMKDKVAPEVESEIKRRYNDGEAVEYLAEQYNITLKYAQRLVGQIPSKDTIFIC